VDDWRACPVKVPRPGAKVLDNISKCRPFVMTTPSGAHPTDSRTKPSSRGSRQEQAKGVGRAGFGAAAQPAQQAVPSPAGSSVTAVRGTGTAALPVADLDGSTTRLPEFLGERTLTPAETTALLDSERRERRRKAIEARRAAQADPDNKDEPLLSSLTRSYTKTIVKRSKA
jgi:hypothetical protein